MRGQVQRVVEQLLHPHDFNSNGTRKWTQLYKIDVDLGKNTVPKLHIEKLYLNNNLSSDYFNKWN